MNKTESVFKDTLAERIRYCEALQIDLVRAEAEGNSDWEAVLKNALDDMVDRFKTDQSELTNAIAELNKSFALPLGWSLESDLKVAKDLAVAVDHNLRGLLKVIAKIEGET